MALIGFAILLLVAWFILVVAVKVTFWAIHIILIAAIIAGVVWLVNRSKASS